MPQCWPSWAQFYPTFQLLGFLSLKADWITLWAVSFGPGCRGDLEDSRWAGCPHISHLCLSFLAQVKKKKKRHLGNGLQNLNPLSAGSVPSSLPIIKWYHPGIWPAKGILKPHSILICLLLHDFEGRHLAIFVICFSMSQSLQPRISSFHLNISEHKPWKQRCVSELESHSMKQWSDFMGNARKHCRVIYTGVGTTACAISKDMHKVAGLSLLLKHHCYK